PRRVRRRSKAPQGASCLADRGPGGPTYSGRPRAPPCCDSMLPRRATRTRVHQHTEENRAHTPCTPPRNRPHPLDPRTKTEVMMQSKTLLLLIPLVMPALFDCSQGDTSEKHGSSTLALSNIGVGNVTSDSATVSWTTNIASLSAVNYGITGSY